MASLDRLAGLVLDGEDPAGVEVDLTVHGRRFSGENAGVEDADIQVDPAFGPWAISQSATWPRLSGWDQGILGGLVRSW